MSLYSLETLSTAPEASEVISVLATALGQKRASAVNRVPASGKGHSIDEGLALLAAYLAIPDPAVRQAILDLVLGLSGINPHS